MNPFQERASSEPSHQPTCSRPMVPEGAQTCPECHSFQPGNTAALKGGLHSPRAVAALLPGQEEIRAALADKRAAVVADLGGEQQLSSIARAEVERYLQLMVLLETLWADLTARGILTTKGKRRAALTAFLQVNDRVDRVVSRLGLERKQKVVSFQQRLATALAAKTEREREP
jgi:hypothetical protein